MGQPELTRIIGTNVPDTVSLNYDNEDGISFCGPRNYDLVLPQGTEDFLVFDEMASTLTLQSDS